MQKGFMKAIAMTAAIIMAQSTAVGVYAATDSTTASTSVSVSDTATNKVKWNNNEGYTVLDKWGNAYPYSFYYYAELSTKKGKEDVLDAYVYIYNILHENRTPNSTIKLRKHNMNAIVIDLDMSKILKGCKDKNGNIISSDNYDYNALSIIRAVLYDSPDLYYAYDYLSDLRNGTLRYPSQYYTSDGKLQKDKVKSDNAKQTIMRFTIPCVYSKKQIAEYDEFLADVVKDFKSKLKENNATTARDFYMTALTYTVHDSGASYGAWGVNSLFNGKGITAASFFKDKTGGCVGYTKAYNYLCQQCGMPFASAGSTGHAWSKVPINNVWYVIDTSAVEVNPGSENDDFFSFVTSSTYATNGGGYSEVTKDKVYVKNYSPKPSDDQVFPKGTSNFKYIPTPKQPTAAELVTPTTSTTSSNTTTKPASTSSTSSSGRKGYKPSNKSCEDVNMLNGSDESLVELFTKVKEKGYAFIVFHPALDDWNERAKAHLEDAKSRGVISYTSIKEKNGDLYIYIDSDASSTSANANKVVSVTIKSDSLKSYKNFKTALTSAVKKAKDGGYGYLKLKTSSTKTLEKYLKQAKKDGIISYTSLKVLDDGIRIKF